MPTTGVRLIPFHISPAAPSPSHRYPDAGRRAISNRRRFTFVTAFGLSHSRIACARWGSGCVRAHARASHANASRESRCSAYTNQWPCHGWVRWTRPPAETGRDPRRETGSAASAASLGVRPRCAIGSKGSGGNDRAFARLRTAAASEEAGRERFRNRPLLNSRLS